MLERLTPKQIKLQAEVRDDWINIALHEQKFYPEECEQAVKWLYYASNLKEPRVEFVNSPEEFSKKFLASVRASVGASVEASVWASVRDSVWASVGDSVWASVRASVRASVEASVWASVRASVWASVRASVRASVEASVRDSVSPCCLSGDAEFGAWYEYWKKINIFQDEKCDKYVGYLRSGAFFVFFFEKVAFVMIRPVQVHQNERKQLHSLTGPAIEWKDGTAIYSIDGVNFDKEWWDKIANDRMMPDEVFAIDNVEDRRIAYQYMDKSKMKSLKDFKVLDEQIDTKGNPMKIISFTVQNMDEPLKFYNCFCPTTMREYFLGTDKTTCLEAKASSFGFNEDEISFENEW